MKKLKNKLKLFVVNMCTFYLQINCLNILNFYFIHVIF